MVTRNGIVWLYMLNNIVFKPNPRLPSKNKLISQRVSRMESRKHMMPRWSELSCWVATVACSWLRTRISVATRFYLSKPKVKPTSNQGIERTVRARITEHVPTELLLSKHSHFFIWISWYSACLLKAYEKVRLNLPLTSSPSHKHLDRPSQEPSWNYLLFGSC